MMSTSAPENGGQGRPPDPLLIAAKFGLVTQAVCPGKTVQRLVGRGLLYRRQIGPGRFSVYQLTKRGCARMAVSLTRSRRFGPAATHRRLSVLTFVFAREDRELVDREDMEKKLGCELPRGIYVAEKVKGQENRRLNLLHLGSPESAAASIARKVRTKLKALEQNQVSSLRIEGGQLIITVLVLPEQVEGTKRLLKDVLGRVRVLRGWSPNRVLSRNPISPKAHQASASDARL